MFIPNPETLNQFEVPKNEESHLKTYYLYFLWYEDILVYIGQTVDLNSRTMAHKKDKYFDKVTYQVFMGITKPEILKIEREHINHFKPPFNDDEKGVIKTPTFALQRGTGKKYKIHQLYDTINEASYYDGIKFQHICSNWKGYFYYEDGKQIKKLAETRNNFCKDIRYYIEDFQLKLEIKEIIKVNFNLIDKSLTSFKLK